MAEFSGFAISYAYLQEATCLRKRPSRCICNLRKKVFTGTGYTRIFTPV